MINLINRQNKSFGGFSFTFITLKVLHNVSELIIALFNKNLFY